MGVLERLSGHLERVERAPGGTLMIQVDEAAHRRHFAAASDALYAARKARSQSLTGEVPDREGMEREDEQIQMLRESLPTFLEDVADRITETPVRTPGARGPLRPLRDRRRDAAGRP